VRVGEIANLQAEEEPLRSEKETQAAIQALRLVGDRARVYFSMPVLEGVTPRQLVDSPDGKVSEDPTGLQRKDGIFGLDEVGVSFLDHVCLYGDAVFEGILIQDRHIFRYREHLERLYRSLAKIHVRLPIDGLTLTARLLETCRAVEQPEQGAAYIRLVVTRGLGDLGINPRKCVSPTIFAIVSTIQLYAREAYEKGIALGLARAIRRPSARILDPNIKSNNYLNNVLAVIEGTREPGLLEALMLTEEGNVAEATVDNVFSVRKSPGWEKDPSQVELHTPSAAYCLVGITRQTVMELAGKRGYRVLERGDLLPIDFVGPEKECFMTGTAAGVMPITRVCGVEVGDGKPGPVTLGLVDDIQAMMRDPAWGLSIDTPKEALPEILGDLALAPASV
jgi:branched-chain amino acid aminotransferase